MKLIRVLKEGRTLSEIALGTQNVLSIPLDYMRYRNLSKGMKLYAYTIIDGGKVCFCYSEKDRNQGDGQRNIVALSNNQYRISMPGYFYTALNHNPGDRYELFHDGNGTLIYKPVNQ